MKQSIIVANWKSHMTESDASEWLKGISETLIKDLQKVILCAPFLLLSSLQEQIVGEKLPIDLGAQNISPFDEGPYTGEINGKQLAEYVKYVIIGHSERRNHFHEDDTMMREKVTMAQKYQIMPIFCVQTADTFIPKDVEIVAFEPIAAIGSGKADSPENANEIAKKLKEQTNIKKVLYGGSVTSENVKSFTSMDHIDGVLVGGASLSPQDFLQIIHNA